MKIFVIRHGQTELNKKNIINGQIDDVLSSEGIEQAKVASSSLPQTIKHIYCSSLQRAKQTAEFLNSVLNVPITFHDELKEVNFGNMQGTPFEGEAKKRHQMVDYDWRPSGESVTDVKERVLKVLKLIKENNKDGEALIVAHGGIVRLLHMLEFGEKLDNIENTGIYSFDLDKIV